MIFWLAAAAMSLMAVAMLLWPLLRRAAPPLARAEYDLEIYRDQLTEIEHDVARGVLAADHAEAARLEIGRRMLATDSVSTQEKPVPAGRARQSWWSGAIGVAVPIAAVLVYLQGGAPDLSDAVKAGPPVAQQPTGDGIDELVERLAR